MSTLYNKFINFFITIIILVIIAYGLNLGIYYFLPKEKPAIEIKSGLSNDYKKFSVKKAFTKKIAKVVDKQKIIVPKKREYQLLSNITLVAIYDLGNGEGVITIKNRGSNKSIILGINEEFKGYKLKSVYRDYVVFGKSNKEYRVNMDVKDMPKFTTTPVRDEKEIEEAQENFNENVKFIDDDTVKISRKYLNNYINDFNKIWQDIAISEYKVNGKINGFRVDSLKKGSAFEKIGLKSGDIMKSVNNIQLTSYNAAFNLYNKIESTRVINMIILRNNLELEINYEIE